MALPSPSVAVRRGRPDLGPGAVCRVFERTPDAYYKRQRRGDAASSTEALVLAHVDTLRAVQPRVGTRKLHDALAKAGVPVGRDQLFTWLRTSGRLV